MEFNVFESIKIGLASPEQISKLVSRRGEKAGNHQLPYIKTGTGRPVLRENFWTDKGLGMLLRQIQSVCATKAKFVSAAA